MQFDGKVGERSARIEVREKDGRYIVQVGDRAIEIDWESLAASTDKFVSALDGHRSLDVALEKTGDGYGVMFDGARYEVDLKEAASGALLGPKAAATGPFKLTAPMPGKIVKVLTSVGAVVEAGQGLIVMEAMKMENELKATRGGTVQEIKVQEGQAVETGALLVIVG